MSLLDTVGEDREVVRGVKNLVVLGLWLPVLFILNGIGLAVLVGLPVLAVRTALTADAETLETAGGAVSGDLVLAALAIGVGFIYLTLIRATFGDERTDASVDTLREVADDTPLPDGGSDD